jgi:hypothetical protein
VNGHSWIHDLVSENEDVETPTSWIYWSLMFAISSAAANNYYLLSLKANLKYFPNLYIMLLGESGLGKGYPVNLAKRLLEEADITRVIAGRSSIQAIIKEGATTKSEKGKPLITDSRMAIINGELSTAIIQDPDALTILTDLFDRPYQEKWTNTLKGDGAEVLKKPYLTCLFGSSPAHFYDSIPQPNIEGGYIGRNLVIYEEKRSKDLDLLDDESESIKDDRLTSYIFPKYIPHLRKIASLSGEPKQIKPDGDAKLIFNNWRREWRANQHIYNDKTGFVNRVPDHVLKVSMCLCLSRYDNNGTIIGADIIEAIEKVSNLIYASQKAAEGGGLDPLANQTKRVVDFLIAAPENQLTRKELLIKGYGDYDTTILDKIIDTLMEMGWVKRKKIGVGSNMDWLILLSGEPKERYMAFKAQTNGKLR